MALEKSEALILRVIPFRDTSKVLTAYTADHGLVSLLAKGVRGAKPRFGAALEILAVSDLVYYHKDSRELQLLAQATLLDPHLGLCGNALRYVYGTAVLEFLLKVLAGQEPPGKLYALSLRTLEVLSDAPPRALTGVFRAFELKAVSFLGHRPELYRCVECAAPATEVPGAGFAALAGGVVCPACAAGVQEPVLPLTTAVLGALRRLLTETLAGIATAPLAPQVEGGVGRILETFLQAHLSRYESLRAVRMAGAIRGRPRWARR